MYLLLIRPIITYAAPIWWNTNHTMSEKLRVLERKSIRACLYMYRSEHSEYQRRTSNTVLYAAEKIPRIDCSWIKLIRDYCSNIIKIENNIIRSLFLVGDNVNRQKQNGYLPPQAFLHCDASGIIQNECNILLLYHWRRNKADKRILLVRGDLITHPESFVGSTQILETDLSDFHRLDIQKYWWLSNDCPTIHALQQRKSRHLEHTRRNHRYHHLMLNA